MGDKLITSGSLDTKVTYGGSIPAPLKIGTDGVAKLLKETPEGVWSDSKLKELEKELSELKQEVEELKSKLTKKENARKRIVYEEFVVSEKGDIV